MTTNMARLAFACLLILGIAATTAMGITVSLSSSEGVEASSSSQSFDLDRSTWLQQDLVLDAGKISSQMQAEGGGNNSLSQSLSGSDYALSSDVNSQGTLSLSTSSFASGQAGSLSQDVAGAGSLSLSLQGEQAGSSAGQEASVAFGTLAGSQSLSAGARQGAFASQSTTMMGQGGKVVSGSLSEENVVLATGSFSGQGRMQAVLASSAAERAFSGGSAAIDDIIILDDGSFKAVSTQGDSQIMGMAGMRLADGGKSIGSFDMSVMNLDLAKEKGAAEVSQTAAAAASGGSYSSYALTGYRLNSADPKMQLYLNPTDTPAGLTADASQSAIAAAANSWDDAVAKNIFADGSTVIVDSTKVVDEPFSNTPKSDGYNVNGWKNFGNSAIGMNRWWSNGAKVDGYYSITESDVWYNRDYQWTTDLATAQSTGKIDLQSVATHELGHSIGMGDIYSTEYGGTLPPSDPRTQDYEQVMNAYDEPQRTLGNGDKAGAQLLYGVNNFRQSKIGVLRNGNWYLDDNGNGVWDSGDVLSFFGTSGDQPVTGDWNFDGKDKIGVLRNAAWYLDANGNRAWDSGDALSFFGTSGDQAVVGDWNGDGNDKIGVLRNGAWYLDNNGDGVWDSGDVLSFFGTSGDQSVAGDWNGDGKDKIGVLRNGAWYLDYNGNGAWDSGDVLSFFGTSGDQPVVGDWNGDGKDEIGVLRNGAWYLDDSGNGAWDLGDVSFWFGTSGDKPVAGYWS